MNAESTEFFAREAAIPEIGKHGLSKLQSACVGIAGVGGVGSAAAYYLSKSGIGNFILVDQDIIEPSNLQRIHMASGADLYHPKAEVLARNISSANRWTSAEPVTETITDRNVDEIFRDADLVIDGLDNFRTRYVLNRHAVRTAKPYLFVSAVSQQAHLSLLDPPRTPCLECIMPDVKDRVENSCEILGVSPAITGIAGAIGASATLQFLLGTPTRILDHLLTIDLNGPEFLYTKTTKLANCQTCVNHLAHDRVPSPAVTSLCGERTANVLPTIAVEYQLPKISARLPAETILLRTDSIIVFRHGIHTISLFRNGRLLIGNVDEETQAGRIAQEVRQLVGTE
jgi:molybdopterin/thiamine biosynthesis adenylyltransferase